MESKIFIVVKKTLTAFIGILFIGFGIAFNSLSLLGNDPVSVLYDGIKNSCNVSLGMASSVVNCLLLLIMIVFIRRKINIGTFLYTFTLGFFINLGASIYNKLLLQDTLLVKILSSVIGCLLLFLGIAIYIVIDFGLDTWNGVTILLSEKLKFPYKFAKISMDVLCIVMGVFLGGVVGVTTLVSAVIGGPIIEIFCKIICKRLSFLAK